MLIKNITISNCSKVVWIDEDFVVVLQRQRPKFFLLVISKAGSITEYVFEKEIFGVLRYGINQWILNTGINSSFICDDNFSIISSLDLKGELILDNIKKSNFLMLNNWMVEPSYRMLLSSVDLSELYKTENQLIILNNNVFEYNSDQTTSETIGKLNFEKKSLEWLTDLIGLGYKGNWPKIYKSNVLCFMHDRFGEINDTMALDANNGELLWKHDIPYKNYYKADQIKDKLISLYDGYIERDIYTGQVTLEHRDEDTFKEFDPRSRGSNFCQVGKHLIAIVHNRNKIYVYNTESHKFDFIYTDPEVKSFVAGHHVVFHNEHLYLMDIEKNMHIYKKEGSWE